MKANKEKIGKCQKERILRYKRRKEKKKQDNRKYIKIYSNIWKEVCDEMVEFIEKETKQFEEIFEINKKQIEEEERRKKEKVIRKSKDYIDFIFLDVDMSDNEKQLHVNRLNKIFEELY